MHIFTPSKILYARIRSHVCRNCFFTHQKRYCPTSRNVLWLVQTHNWWRQLPPVVIRWYLSLQQVKTSALHTCSFWKYWWVIWSDFIRYNFLFELSVFLIDSCAYYKSGNEYLRCRLQLTTKCEVQSLVHKVKHPLSSWHPFARLKILMLSKACYAA